MSSGSQGLSPRRLTVGRNRAKTEGPMLRYGKGCPSPETGNQLCRDTEAPESQCGTAEKHRLPRPPICRTEVLQKPHGPFWECVRTKKAHPQTRQLLTRYEWKVFTKPAKSFFLKLTFLPIDSYLSYYLPFLRYLHFKPKHKSLTL